MGSGQGVSGVHGAAARGGAEIVFSSGKRRAKQVMWSNLQAATRIPRHGTIAPQLGRCLHAASSGCLEWHMHWAETVPAGRLLLPQCLGVGTAECRMRHIQINDQWQPEHWCNVGFRKTRVCVAIHSHVRPSCCTH